MSELPTFVNDRNGFFAELDNSFWLLKDYVFLQIFMPFTIIVSSTEIFISITNIFSVIF